MCCDSRGLYYHLCLFLRRRRAQDVPLHASRVTAAGDVEERWVTDVTVVVVLCRVGSCRLGVGMTLHFHSRRREYFGNDSRGEILA